MNKLIGADALHSTGFAPSKMLVCACGPVALGAKDDAIQCHMAMVVTVTVTVTTPTVPRRGGSWKSGGSRHMALAKG